MTTTTEKTVVHLTCGCCGKTTKGQQGWNRDTGYGLGKEGAEWLPTKRGVPAEEMHDLCGVRGVHYDLPGEER